MKSTPSLLAVALLIAAAPAAHGFELGEFAGSQVSFEGLLQSDHYWYDTDRALLDGDPGDGHDSDHGIRRAELVLKGKGSNGLDWVVGYDVEAESWLDVNAGFDLGGGHQLRVGQFKQPSGLEELSSAKNNDFISKAAATNAFALSRRLGASYGYAGNDWSVTASAFGRHLTSGGAHGAGHAIRGTWAPINTNGQVLHLGLSYLNHDTDADQWRLRVRPQADMAGDRLVDTGSFHDADRVGTTGVEAFWTRGPLKLQGEYLQSRVDRMAGADYQADGGYLSALYNLSGEGWSYRNGVPGTASPADPARGMWQLGLRLDRVDLDDTGVDGGRMDAATLGVNWYWRQNFKLALNWSSIDSERAGIPDDPSVVAVRAQMHW
ncbi:OprO/OprP family phosphate-selective porin [Lysobacter sp. GX 14042]|uniref:OprO/OprP family phosphate-selective porin n=1 Tax=Lysobacter sp. GX 14042 TaxID=2907155 RepID=UPI001F245309|nr:OprO/OprP family phosphate-selective porin [Lysobacter sp. GX 14042]